MKNKLPSRQNKTTGQGTPFLFALGGLRQLNLRAHHDEKKRRVLSTINIKKLLKHAQQTENYSKYIRKLLRIASPI